jgi:hypothetical protein
MLLIVSFLMALLPLLGIAWIVLNGLLFTVDGLFMGLILITISGICGTTALFELRKGKPSSATGGTKATSSSVAGGLVQRGKVQSVQFFESNVGQPNKSIVTLSDGSKSPVTMVFEGDLRNALPVGQKVEVTLRKETGYNVLVNVSYA